MLLLRILFPDKLYIILRFAIGIDLFLGWQEITVSLQYNINYAIFINM